MSLKRIIQDMKGELGNISKKGVDVKFGNGARSRSHSIVQDCSGPIDAFKKSCWANMPAELLRDVLMRIEASDITWPPRKNVVACAGVCGNWREIMKEIAKSPEISGKLTFPISLKQLPMMMESSFLWPGCAAGLPNRSNFLGTKFTIYDSQPANSRAKVSKSCSTSLMNVNQVSPQVPAGNYPVAHISYELNILGSRGPRRMQCIMDAIPASSEPGGVAPTQTEFLHSNPDTFPSLPFFRSKSTCAENFQSVPLSDQKDGMLVLRNNAPRLQLLRRM